MSKQKAILRGALLYATVSVAVFSVGHLVGYLEETQIGLVDHGSTTEKIVPLSTPAPTPVPELPLISNRNSNIYSLPKADHIPNQRVLAAFPQGYDAGRNVTLAARNCEITSMVEVQRFDLEKDTDASRWWTLSTLDVQGNPKHLGGDEFYITYTADGSAEPAAIANITDWNNGTYSFHFVGSPTVSSDAAANATQTRGTLKVILEQSCGIGALDPPLKQNWLTSGAINQIYTIHNITAPKVIQPFVRPNLDGAIDFGAFDIVSFTGDSIIGQMACPDICAPDVCSCTTFRPDMYRGCQIGACLNTKTWGTFRLQASRDLVEAKRRARYQTPQLNREPKLALVVSSGVWEILADETSEGGLNFADHLQAVREYIVALRQDHPTINIFWKSMTAMHIHEVVNMDDWVHIERVYYMSNTRARRLDQLQKALMKELGVRVLDVFDAFYYSAHKTKPGDGRHFTPEFNLMVNQWFYPPPKVVTADEKQVA